MICIVSRFTLCNGGFLDNFTLSAHVGVLFSLQCRLMYRNIAVFCNNSITAQKYNAKLSCILIIYYMTTGKDVIAV